MLDERGNISKGSINKCQLENGEIVIYDEAKPVETYRCPETFEYLGRGKIYSSNGVRQPGIDTLHFFKRIAPVPKSFNEEVLKAVDNIRQELILIAPGIMADRINKSFEKLENLLKKYGDKPEPEKLSTLERRVLSYLRDGRKVQIADGTVYFTRRNDSKPFDMPTPASEKIEPGDEVEHGQTGCKGILLDESYQRYIESYPVHQEVPVLWFGNLKIRGAFLSNLILIRKHPKP